MNKVNNIERTGLSEDLLQKILTIIIRTTDPNRVVLYGSRSRGDYNLTSDIDLAVSSEDMHGVQDQLNEEAPTLLKIDLINLNKAKGSLKEEIERKEILLYEKRANLSGVKKSFNTA